MNIKLHNAGEGNIGAELMTVAAINAVKETISNARVVANPSHGSYVWRASHGMYQLLDGGGHLTRILQVLLHKGYRERFGLVIPDDLDAVLDISGYAYGDAFDAKWIEETAAIAEKERRRGVYRVLLPQAFGPFDNPQVAKASAGLLMNTDLVFTRDEDSFRSVSSLVPEHKGVHIAPDFTNLVKGKKPGNISIDENTVLLIPNAQMILRGLATKDNYLGQFFEIGIAASNAGFTPAVLVHDKRMDRELVHTLQQMSNSVWPLLSLDDPLEAKWIIGKARFIVASRFHAIVSALSQGVPALGIGWSHKYEHLFDSYGYKEWSLPCDDAAIVAPPILGRFADISECEDIHQQLLLKSEMQCEQSRLMWEKVSKSLHIHKRHL